MGNVHKYNPTAETATVYPVNSTVGGWSLAIVDNC